MNYLVFELAEAGEGVSALEAMASTRMAQQAQVMAEVEQVLAWAWRQFPHSHGAVDDGLDWDHEVRVVTEDGGWCTVTLTLSGSDRFVEAFQQRFGPVGD